MNFYDKIPINYEPYPQTLPNDIFYKINELENKINKLEIRISYLEQEKNNNYIEPDNKMYMI